MAAGTNGSSMTGVIQLLSRLRCSFECLYSFAECFHLFFFFVAICKVLNFLAFRLPTQSNLELPANSNLIHYRKFIPFFFFFFDVLLEQSFDSMWSGSQAQLRLRNPVVRVKWGWQKQGIWDDSDAAFNSTPRLPASTERLRDQGH